MGNGKLTAETVLDVATGGDSVRIGMDIIRRDRKKLQLRSAHIRKIFRRTLNKRLLLKDYTTKPHGWVAENQEEKTNLM